MCGIVGIFSHRPVAHELYDGLIHLQHRGTDAAGILTYGDRFHIKKGGGYVRDIFHEKNMTRLEGTMGIGHNRYSTTGNAHSVENAQPMYMNSPYGIGMAHNGNLVNYYALKQELAQDDRYHCNTDSDLEVILSLFASSLSSSHGSDDMFERICQAVSAVFDRASGGYSVIAMIAGHGMVAFRDPHGIRPLVHGIRHHADGSHDYIFSSENTMYYPLGFRLRGNVEPGEVVYIDMQGEKHRRRLRTEQFTPCLFEYVYLARPDSVINNISVYRARLRMGQNLAKKWMRKQGAVLPDVVVPVPFSSNTAALAMAHELGVRYSEGLYKNGYVGRTFIMPGQEKRRKSVLQKLSPQEIELRGKTVMLLDDSIVRGTTSKEVVRLVRDAGAKKVYFVSACPEVKYPDYYGIDIPTRDELIAAHKSVEEIREFMNADILMYQDIADIVEAVTRRGDHHVDRLSMPCLDGWYVTGDVQQDMQEKIEQMRLHERSHTIIS
jgi:amidophosphoribosyltransferase